MSRSTVVEAEFGGMTVLAAHMPRARSCVGVLSVPVGYGADPPGQEGAAHLTEHICVATAAGRDGVQMAARTEVSATRYSARATPGSSAVLTATLASVFAARPYGADLHEAERRAVLTENARFRDQPQLQIAPAVASLAVPHLDLGVRDTTTEATIGAVTPADIVAFRQRWYRPEGAVLCVVGPTDPDTLVAHAHTALAETLPRIEALAQQPPLAPARPLEAAGWSNCHIWATVTPAVPSAADLLAREIATELLTGPAGLLDEASAAAGTRATGSATLPGRRSEFLVTAWPSGPHAPGLVTNLSRELPQMLAGGRGEAAIAKARARLRTRVAFDQQSPSSLTAMLVRYAQGKGSWPEVRDIDATPDDRVADLAAQMLHGATFWQITDGRLGKVAEQP